MYRKYPYTNYHDINLDWIVEEIKATQDTLDEIKNWRDTWTERLDQFERDTENLLNLYYQLEADYETFTENVDQRFVTLTNELINQVEQLKTELNNYIQQQFIIMNYRLDGFDSSLSNLSNRVDHIMDDLFTTFTMINPFTGREEQVLNVIDYLASLHMTDALTAGEYDALDMTAQYYDNKQLNARDYDQYGKTLLP